MDINSEIENSEIAYSEQSEDLNITLGESEEEFFEPDNQHGVPLWLRFLRYWKTFHFVQESVITQVRFGFCFYVLVATIIFVVVKTIHKGVVEPETRIIGYLEGTTYSTNNDKTKIWEVKDTLIPGYPVEQVFVPTIIRITPNQKQEKCESPTILCKYFVLFVFRQR